MTQPNTESELWIARMVRDHAGAVRGYLLGMVKDGSLADDLAQEAFRRLWLARDRYRDQGQERAYLLRIADRLVIDHARRKRPETLVDPHEWRGGEPVSADAAARNWCGIKSRVKCKELPEQLSEGQRRVLLLRFYGSMEFHEIAKAMDCPLGTVLSHC
ncbi:MAG: RNA polymerase sigma factor [Pirellulales bacterium]